MPKIAPIVRGVSLVVALGLAACDDDDSGTSNRLVPCLDRPGPLERAPKGKLPCDLLPPDFKR